jgi:hypothetical protein
MNLVHMILPSHPDSMNKNKITRTSEKRELSQQFIIEIFNEYRYIHQFLRQK